MDTFTTLPDFIGDPEPESALSSVLVDGDAEWWRPGTFCVMA